MASVMSKDEPAAIPEEKAKKKLPLPVILGASIAVGGLAAAAVYFLAPDSLLPQSKNESVDTPIEASGHGEKSEKSDDHGEAEKNHGEDDSGSSEGESGNAKFHVSGDVGVFSPEPIVVSIRPIGRVRYLKLGYVVETSPESGETFIERENRIRDTLNIYLRAVDVAALEDPASLVRIREQIARRVAVVVEPAPVHSVLITDFILS